MEKVRLPPVDEQGGELQNDGAGAGAVGPTHGGKRTRRGCRSSGWKSGEPACPQDGGEDGRWMGEGGLGTVDTGSEVSLVRPRLSGEDDLQRASTTIRLVTVSGGSLDGGSTVAKLFLELRSLRGLESEC